MSDFPPALASAAGASAPLPGDDAFRDEDQFRLLAENLPVLCWMAGADGAIFWYNRFSYEYCGTTPEEMTGWGWQTVHDPAVLPDVLARWTEAILAGESFEMTFPLRGADGVFRPFLTRVQPLRDAAGAVARWFGISFEVTAQLDAEARLTAANSRLQAIAAEREAILGQLSEGVIVTDRDGRITFVNEAATRLHGVARLDVGPDDYSEAYHLLTRDGDPHPPATLPLTRAVVAQETVVDAHWRIRRPDGSEILAIGNAKPVRDAEGKPIAAVLTIRDDTQRHAAETALQQALLAKEALLEEVNHRVKNSLQLVTSLLSLQANKTPSDEVRQGLLTARGRIAVVAGLHERLYTTSRHDRVDLATYLRELAVDSIAALDGDARVTLQFDADGEIVVPLEQAVPLALIVSELLTNCLKYAFAARSTGMIRLSVAASADDVVIGIRDDGCGLPPGFEIGSSGGLGLRISAALLRQVRGQLEVLPSPAGAAFRLTMPLSAAG